MLEKFMISSNDFKVSLRKYEERNLSNQQIEQLVAREIAECFAKYGRDIIRNQTLQSICRDFFTTETSLPARRILLEEGGPEALCALYGYPAFELKWDKTSLKQDDMMWILEKFYHEILSKMYLFGNSDHEDELHLLDISLILGLAIEVTTFYQIQDSFIENALRYLLIGNDELREKRMVLTVMGINDYCPKSIIPLLIDMKQDWHLYIYALPFILDFAAENDEYDTLEFYRSVLPLPRNLIGHGYGLGKYFLSEPHDRSPRLIQVFEEMYLDYLTDECELYLALAKRDVAIVLSYYEKNEEYSRKIIFQNFFAELNLA